jgi:REP element-mobilizing transposase RayT
MPPAGYNPEIHHRHSIRLRGYDYSQAGVYFITLCIEGRTSLLGHILDGQMHLNDVGKMIEKTWNEIPQFYMGFDVDVFQIMPNHFHSIIKIVGGNNCLCRDRRPNEQSRNRQPQNRQLRDGQPRGVAPTVGDIVGRFKTMTTKRYSDRVKEGRWRPFNGKLWQRNYYEHIIRNDSDYHRICQYITNNAANWNTDKLYNE